MRMVSFNSGISCTKDISRWKCRNILTEFLHNMSHQALNKDKDNIFIQFDRMAELIFELISLLLDRNNKSLNIANIINNDIHDEINDDSFTFDIPTQTEVQQDMEKYLKKNKKKRQHCLLPMFHHHH